MSEKQNETAKIHLRNQFENLLQNHWVSTKLGTIHLWLKGIQVCTNEELFNSHRWIMDFFFS